MVLYAVEAHISSLYKELMKLNKCHIPNCVETPCFKAFFWVTEEECQIRLYCKQDFKAYVNSGDWKRLFQFGFKDLNEKYEEWTIYRQGKEGLPFVIGF